MNKLVALESEFFTVTSGFHRFFETVLSAGYKLPNQHIIAVMSTSGVISEGDRRYSSVYGLYRLNADLWGGDELGLYSWHRKL